MEKIPDIEESESLAARLADKPIMEALHIGFEPLVLQRPLKHFNKALGMCAGVAGFPDPDFIVHILEGRGHQEGLRKAAGSQFKNLEHFLRGAHTPTATTWSLMLLNLKTDTATLQSLAHGKRDGPLLPAYVSLFQALEGIFLRSYRAVTVGAVRCPCSGGDVLDDAHTWWEAQPLSLGRGGTRFVDRLLGALLGGVSLLELLGHFTSCARLDRTMLAGLAAPKGHPIGNWMDLVKRARGLRHDWELLVGTDSNRNTAGPPSDGRLRKWRSGVDLMPLEKALSMVEATADETILKHAMLAARTLSLAIDVVQSTAETSSRPTRKLAQEMVSARLSELDLHLRMGVAALAKARPNRQPGQAGN